MCSNTSPLLMLLLSLGLSELQVLEDLRGVMAALVIMASGSSIAGPTNRRLQQIRQDIRWGSCPLPVSFVLSGDHLRVPIFLCPWGALGNANNEHSGGQPSGGGQSGGSWSCLVLASSCHEAPWAQFCLCFPFLRECLNPTFMGNSLILKVGHFLNKRYSIVWIQQNLHVDH